MRCFRLVTVTILSIVTVLLSTTIPKAQASEPTQVDRGKAVYLHYCSTCHGDRGQGLTDEWRATFPPRDQNCWQSKCHALNHPPEGFVFPHIVPAVAGPDALTKFNTAQQLYGFISKAMPYYAPGLLTSDQYTDITAFLLTLNNVNFDGTLTPDTESLIHLRPQTSDEAQPASYPAIVLIAVVISGVAGVTMFVWRRRANR